jgi:hypothetical protein
MHVAYLHVPPLKVCFYDLQGDFPVTFEEEEQNGYMKYA